MTEVELSLRVVDVLGERVAKSLTVMFPLALSESFQDRSETLSIIENTVDSFRARSIERGHFNDWIGELLTRTGVQETPSA